MSIFGVKSESDEYFCSRTLQISRLVIREIHGKDEDGDDKE